MAFPVPDNTAYVKVTPLVAGTITLPEKAFITPVDPTIKRSVPCLCFIVEHPHQRFMFDLGLRSDPKNYIPEIQAHLPNRQPVTHRPSSDEILRANGIPPESIQSVVLSHVHWDHHGDPSSYPQAQFYVGRGSLHVLEHGIGHGSHSHFDKKLFVDHAHHEFSDPQLGQPILNTIGTPLQALVGAEKAKQMAPAVWQALGPFPAAADLFGDGSIYIVPAPGHLPGHINLLCRTSASEWIYLGGDVYHDSRLLTGEKSIATWEEHGQICCVHIDKEQALQSIRRIAELVEIMEKQELSVEVIASHDSIWYGANKHKCLTMPS